MKAQGSNSAPFVVALASWRLFGLFSGLAFVAFLERAFLDWRYVYVDLTRDVATTGLMLAVYSLGLAIPFLLTAIAFARMTTAFGFIKRHYAAIMAIGGLILIAMGVLVFTGELSRLNLEAQQALDDLGINFFNEI